LDQIKESDRGEGEHDERYCVASPALLLRRVDPREAIDYALDRPEDPRKRGGAALHGAVDQAPDAGVRTSTASITLARVKRPLRLIGGTGSLKVRNWFAEG
jgi:hypothetical protein